MRAGMAMGVDMLAESDTRWEGARHVLGLLEREANTTEVNYYYFVILSLLLLDRHVLDIAYVQY